MKKIWMLALIPAIALGSCGKSNEPTAAQAEKMAETGKKICEKMFECIDEQLQNMPAEQREMARSMMGGKEACYKEYGVNETGDAAKPEQIEVQYTKEELDLAIQCMEEITKTSCQQLMSEEGQPASCKKLAEIAEKREKK